MKSLIDKLRKDGNLTDEEFKLLITEFNDEIREYAAKIASEVRQKCYSNKIYLFGYLEFTNICKNNCYYCGIRRDNTNNKRYRLTKDIIHSRFKTGYNLGIRSFILQGGEDRYYTDDILCEIIYDIKTSFPDCTITVAAGERGYYSFLRLKKAGVDRYILRHETADAEHYGKLHPNSMSFNKRMKCLNDLKELGYQVGCGFMVGSPYQTTDTIVKDLRFIKEFTPQLIGIGPFVPSDGTPFEDMPAGSVPLTLFIISLLRIMNPNCLIPSNPALSSLVENGIEQNIIHGANVIFPNLTPDYAKKNYTLYNNKQNSECDTTEILKNLKESFKNINCEISFG